MGIENSGYMLLFFFLLIPIIIHLLSFVKTKKVFFSRTVFLQQVIHSKNKVNKLKYLAVLASRVLALLFLIIAVLSYLVSANKTYSNQKHGVYFIDNSLSIDTHNDGILEAVKKYILADLSTYESASLNENNLDKKGLYFYTKDAFKDLLDEVEITNAPFNLSKVISRYNHINRISTLTEGESEMVLISDFQKPISVSDEEDFTNWKIVRLNNDFEKFNVIIDSVWLESPFVELGKVSQLSVNYSSSGTGAANVTCKLFINDIQVATSTIENSKGSLRFDFTIEKSGDYACRLEIDDEVVFDNTYFFTMSTGNKIHIAVLTENGGSNLIKKVYENEPTFEVSTYSKGNLSIDELSKFNVIILDQIKGNELLAGLLKTKLKTSTIVYIPPTDLIDQDLILNELKNHVGIIRLVEDTTFYRLSSTVNDNFFDGVFSDNKTKFDFTTSKKMMALSQNHSNSIVSFLDKSPLLAKKDQLYVFTVPFNNDFTGIHTHALFVPIMYKIAMSSTHVNTQLSYFIDEEVKLIGDFSVNDKISLKSKNDNLLIDFTLGPNSEIVFDAGKYAIQPGIYKLEKNDSTFAKIAFNLNKSESKMEFYSEDEVKNMFPEATVENLSINNWNENLSSSQKSGVSIWKYCLTLSLVFLFIEIILINYLK